MSTGNPVFNDLIVEAPPPQIVVLEILYPVIPHTAASHRALPASAREGLRWQLMMSSNDGGCSPLELADIIRFTQLGLDAEADYAWRNGQAVPGKKLLAKKSNW